MGSTFNPQILVEKLTKLNSSQQSIETLSHWCIFHMNKAKLVVETWDKQFHCSSRDRRLAFLYLANDILQNSRRKGAEFVSEFWSVLPEALRDVIRNGGDAERNAARRLINIWDERKVFGSHGHILKEEFVGRQSDNSDTNGKQPNLKLRQSVGNVLDKIVSDFEMLYGGELDEEALLSKCTSTISTLAKIIKDSSNGVNSGKLSGSGTTEEMQGQHASLRGYIEQLTSLESTRASFVSHLRVVLQGEELKLNQLQSQLQAAQLLSEQVTTVFQQLTKSENITVDEQGSSVPPAITHGEGPVPPVVYTQQASLSDIKSASIIEDDSRKSAAAAVAAKLTASTSSAEMLSLALTSLVSGVAFCNNNNNNNLSLAQESLGEHRLEKRAKVENEPCSYTSPPVPPSPPFLHPNNDNNNNNNTSTSQRVTPGEQPPLPSSSPPPQPLLPSIMPPYPMPPQFFQTAGSMSNVAYDYGSNPQPPPALCGPGYPSVGSPMTGMSPYGPPGSPFQPYQVSEGGFYSPPSSVSMASMSHQRSS